MNVSSARRAGSSYRPAAIAATAVVVLVLSLGVVGGFRPLVFAQSSASRTPFGAPSSVPAAVLDHRSPSSGSGNSSGNTSYGGSNWGVTPSNGSDPFAVALMATPGTGFAPLHAYLQASVCSGSFGAIGQGGCFFPPPNTSAPFDITVCGLPGRCIGQTNWSGTGAFSSWFNYTSGGLYNVTATLRNSTGATSTGWIVLDVVAPIFELVVFPGTGSAPLSVNLSGEVLGGQPPYAMTICAVPTACVTNRTVNASGLWTVNYTYAATGNYSASANVTDAFGVYAASVAAVIVTSGAPMVVRAQSSGPTSHSPNTVDFRTQVSGGSPPYTLQWWFGDGTTGSGVNGGWTSHTFGAAGTFYPKLTVRDAAGHSASESPGAVVIGAGASPANALPSVTGPNVGPAALGAGSIVVAAAGVLLAAWGVRRWARVRTAEASELVHHLTQDEVDPELFGDRR